MISSINNDLRSKGHKVTLEIKRNSIWIRGTFPLSDGTKKRKYVSTGLTADPKSAPLAEIRSIALLTAIKETGSLPDPLPWENKKLDKSGYPKVKVKDAILQLKEDFFGVETKNPISRNNTWKTMQYGLEKLNPDAYLTTDYLASMIIEGSKNPDGKTMNNTKKKLKQYYKRLGNLVDLPDIKNLDKIEVVYEPTIRNAPDMKDLLDLAVEAIPHDRYGWLTACMIIYGCRPSETLSLFPNPNGTAKVLTIKKKKGLPTWRTTMAIPKDFPEKLNLFEISRPIEFKNPSDFDPVESKKITDQWGRWIKKFDPELQLYDLRHSWARRSIIEGVPSGLASRCLGHSITVFEKTYLSTTSEKDVVDYLERN
tara:strand:- start:2 stop:1105 length:1104 start_codon:yes stop_codon:yes gene_type:complete